MSEKKIGEVTHYFTDINVGAINMTDTLEIGDTIHIKGETTDFIQEIKSMEIDEKSIEKAAKGDHIAIKVNNRVRENDEVFKVDN